jgi:hypothetical protein
MVTSQGWIEGQGEVCTCGHVYAGHDERTAKCKFCPCARFQERATLKASDVRRLLKGIEDYIDGSILDACPPPGRAQVRAAIRGRLREFGDWVDNAEAVVASQGAQTEVTCVWCGQAFPPGTPQAGHDLLLEHAKVCEKHPLADATRRSQELDAALRTLIDEAEFYSDDPKLKRQVEAAKRVRDKV